MCNRRRGRGLQKDDTLPAPRGYRCNPPMPRTHIPERRHAARGTGPGRAALVHSGRFRSRAGSSCDETVSSERRGAPAVRQPGSLEAVLQHRAVRTAHSAAFRHTDFRPCCVSPSNELVTPARPCRNPECVNGTVPLTHALQQASWKGVSKDVSLQTCFRVFRILSTLRIVFDECYD